MNLIKRLKQNIYSPSYYQNLVDRPIPASHSFKYYFALVSLLAVAYTAVVSVFFIPLFLTIAKSSMEGIIANFPEKLEITIRNHEATTNLKQPIYIPLPSNNFLFDELRKTTGYKNLMVVDTRNDTYDPVQYKNYQTIFLLKAKSIVSADQSNKVSIDTFSDIKDVKVTKTTLDNIFGKMRLLTGVLAPFLVLVAYFLFFLAMVFYLIPLFVGAFIIWLWLNMAGRKITYWRAYRVAMHASTLPLVANIFIFFLWPFYAYNLAVLAILFFLTIYFNFFFKSKVMEKLAD